MPDIGHTPFTTRRATNVTLPQNLVALAKELGVNISQACEAGSEAQVKAARAAKWLEENRAAIEYCNTDMEENGLLPAEYRQF